METTEKFDPYKKVPVDSMRYSGRLLYEVIAGSHLYGTNTPSSDVDTRGYYFIKPEEYLSLREVEPQLDENKNDIVFYNLKRAFELLKTANPNQIELLFPAEDCIRYKFSPIMDELFANRKLFISKKAYYTHAAYSVAQIGKMRGKNKKVHNPQPVEMPKKEDFCKIIDMRDDRNIPIHTIEEIAERRIIRNEKDLEYYTNSNRFPFRPISLKESGIDLSKCHISSLEHIPYTYRLYLIGDKSKGVFRGDQMLCCESISKEEEILNFIGLFSYNKEDYDRDLKEWHSYWDWMSNRNDARWIDQEKGLLTYDQKNAMHCVRLLMSSESILTTGEPLVRVTGENREYLMNIRNGKYSYEEVMAKVEEKNLLLENLLKTSTIPEHVDMDKLDALFKHLMEIGQKKLNIL